MSRYPGFNVGLVAVLAACASGKTGPRYTDAAELPPHLADPVKHPHPDCPAGRGLPAVGRSVTSPDEARIRALNAVAANVSSQVQGVIRDQQKLVIAHGQASSTTSLEQRIEQRAAFSHAELVRVVGGVERHGEEWFALACLDRARAATVLDEETAAPLQVVTLSVDRARTAAAAQDATAFATARAEAVEAATRVFPLLAQRRVILDDATAGQRMETLQQGMATLRELASTLRNKVRVVLAVEAPALAENARGVLGDRVRNALTAMRIPVVMQAAPGCAPEASHALTLHAEPGCGWGSLGHTCKPAVSLKGTACDTGTALFDSPFPGALRGSTTQGEAQALEKALRGFDDAAVAQWLGSLMRGVAAE
ncbi:MAG: hypothetical protein HY904_20310 [Deltaproteobacteria bacterium]|nr:hypothetical protein [Deltaproteobacteria bacterium]